MIWVDKLYEETDSIPIIGMYLIYGEISENFNEIKEQLVGEYLEEQNEMERNN